MCDRLSAIVRSREAPRIVRSREAPRHPKSYVRNVFLIRSGATKKEQNPPRNVFLIRSTMCDQENRYALKNALEQNVRLYMMGLDKVSRRCETWQNPSVNFGDTVTICDDTPNDRKRLWKNKGFVKLSDAPTGTLDAALAAGVFDRKVDLMKMDVEGYEPHILASARKFFASKFAPNKILMEAEVDRLEDALGSGAEQLKREFLLLLEYGYVTGGMDTVQKVVEGFRGAQGNPEFGRKGGRRLLETFLEGVEYEYVVEGAGSTTTTSSGSGNPPSSSSIAGSLSQSSRGIVKGSNDLSQSPGRIVIVLERRKEGAESR